MNSVTRWLDYFPIIAKYCNCLPKQIQNFAQTQYKTFLNCQILLKILPKLRNFAKSGNTDYDDLQYHMCNKRLCLIEIVINWGYENDEMNPLIYQTEIDNFLANWYIFLQATRHRSWFSSKRTASSTPSSSLQRGASGSPTGKLPPAKTWNLDRR